MSKILTRFGYRINKSYISDKILESIKSELTVKPHVKEDYGGIIEEFPVYRDNEKYIWLPRNYAMDKFGIPDKNKLKSEKIDIKFSGKLRDYQIDMVNTCLEGIKEHGGGILSAGCGAGKTVMAIKTICDLGVKTLIIVHKTFLQDQWVDRIKEFTNAKIGTIRGKKIDIEGKDIVVGMLQSISMKDYDNDVFKKFGYVIVDEAHHIAAQVFSQALLKITSPYMFGLSATPFRTDGLTKILFWFIGPILYKYTRNTAKMNVQVKRFKYYSRNDLFKEKMMRVKWQQKPALSRMITNFTQIKGRNKFILNILKSLIKIPNRKTLVLSGRIEHLETLKAMLDKYIEKQVATNKFDTNEITTSFYIGRMKEYELRDAVDADVIFASYSMAEEGLDIKTLNTLVMVTSKSSIEQSVGRILRQQDADIHPLIIDVCDDVSLFENQGKKREKFYRKKKYSIDTKYVCEKELTDKDYFSAYKFNEDNNRNEYKESMDDIIADNTIHEVIKESNTCSYNKCLFD